MTETDKPVLNLQNLTAVFGTDHGTLYYDILDEVLCNGGHDLGDTELKINYISSSQSYELVLGGSGQIVHESLFQPGSESSLRNLFKNLKEQELKRLGTEKAPGS